MERGIEPRQISAQPRDVASRGCAEICCRCVQDLGGRDSCHSSRRRPPPPPPRSFFPFLSWIFNLRFIPPMVFTAGLAVEHRRLQLLRNEPVCWGLPRGRSQRRKSEAIRRLTAEKVWTKHICLSPQTNKQANKHKLHEDGKPMLVCSGLWHWPESAAKSSVCILI